VPKYSNPDGITYSDDTVKRFAALSPAAEDFRIFWDNAYCVHDLTEKGDQLLNILSELKKNEKEDMIYIFASTAKITFAGAGIAAICASKKNIKFLSEKIFVQTIGPDKINQLKHVQFLKDKDGIKAHMAKHRKILKPKFEAVSETLEKNLKELKESNLVRWANPNGGYFISLFVPEGCAKKTVELSSELGVALTPAGSTYPYKKDPYDSNIRIAPTFPSVQELILAIDVLCICIKLAYIEKII
jgi:DNA-binding transcriptional MocR family regulator